MNLKNFFKQYGKEKQIKKGEYLFKAKENDTNIYFIEEGKFILKINNNKIAIIESNEISGEKSFLQNTPKPIDAQALIDSKVYEISQETYKNLEENTKTKFLTLLTLFVSDRVYLLNTVIQNISYISNFINQKKPTLKIEYFKELLEKIFNIEQAYIFEIYENNLLPIFTSDFNPQINELASQYIKTDTLKITNNQIAIKIGNFLFIFIGEKKQTNYIINNTLIHSLASLKYLGELLNNKKNNELNNLLK